MAENGLPVRDSNQDKTVSTTCKEIGKPISGTELGFVCSPALLLRQTNGSAKRDQTTMTGSPLDAYCDSATDPVHEVSASLQKGAGLSVQQADGGNKQFKRRVGGSVQAGIPDRSWDTLPKVTYGPASAAVTKVLPWLASTHIGPTRLTSSVNQGSTYPCAGVSLVPVSYTHLTLPTKIGV